MQFYLNGFRPGDPEISEPAEAARRADALADEVDVLIVGCGPAGLTLAAQLAAFPDIRTRIVEQKSGPLLLGQADGVACRTMEMFEAFGFSERVMKEAYWVNETSFWKPHDNQRANIVRSGRVQDVEDGLSEFPHVILNQARVHGFYLDVMRNAPARLEPDYSRQLIDLTILPGGAEPDGGSRASAYPVTVRLKRLDPAAEGQEEIVRARFVVGCDGARSAVRKALGLSLDGDSANQAWGVMDVLAISDFPDFRLKAAVQSASEGSLLIIPREGGYIVRPIARNCRALQGGSGGAYVCDNGSIEATASSRQACRVGVGVVACVHCRGVVIALHSSPRSRGHPPWWRWWWTLIQAWSRACRRPPAAEVELTSSLLVTRGFAGPFRARGNFYPPTPKILRV
jgi:hypothetical protein